MELLHFPVEDHLDKSPGSRYPHHPALPLSIEPGHGPGQRQLDRTGEQLGQARAQKIQRPLQNHHETTTLTYIENLRGTLDVQIQ
jgi:hypothetical protein